MWKTNLKKVIYFIIDSRQVLSVSCFFHKHAGNQGKIGGYLFVIFVTYLVSISFSQTRVGDYWKNGKTYIRSRLK